ncbi:hypothetical protein DBV15_03580 [Temnothorax longispinosus]|uniref:Uncharacterized protein n=1 Tax=Temnothorax longispinosus TaxID=300112 RepID=A0A4S2KKL2_9HYME|nr:hypothetical protein DBV15_03580 [Temnothorax longispinosus]
MGARPWPHHVLALERNRIFTNVEQKSRIMGERPSCADSLKVSRKSESPLTRVFRKRETISGSFYKRAFSRDFSPALTDVGETGPTATARRLLATKNRACQFVGQGERIPFGLNVNIFEELFEEKPSVHQGVSVHLPNSQLNSMIFCEGRLLYVRATSDSKEAECNSSERPRRGDENVPRAKQIRIAPRRAGVLGRPTATTGAYFCNECVVRHKNISKRCGGSVWRDDARTMIARNSARHGVTEPCARIKFASMPIALQRPPSDIATRRAAPRERRRDAPFHRIRARRKLYRLSLTWLRRSVGERSFVETEEEEEAEEVAEEEQEEDRPRTRKRKSEGRRRRERRRGDGGDDGREGGRRGGGGRSSWEVTARKRIAVIVAVVADVIVLVVVAVAVAVAAVVVVDVVVVVVAVIVVVADDAAARKPAEIHAYGEVTSARNERIIPGRARSPTRRSPTKQEEAAEEKEEEEEDDDEEEEEEEEEEVAAEEEENAAKFADGNKDGFSARSRKRLAGDACSTKDRERVSRRLARGTEPEKERMVPDQLRGSGVPRGIGAKEPESARERARKREGERRGQGEEGKRETEDGATTWDRERVTGVQGRMGDADRVEGLDEAQPRSVGARGATGGEPSLRRAQQKRGRLLRGSDEDGRCARDSRAETGETDREQDVDRRHAALCGAEGRKERGIRRPRLCARSAKEWARKRERTREKFGWNVQTERERKRGGRGIKGGIERERETRSGTAATKTDADTREGEESGRQRGRETEGAIHRKRNGDDIRHSRRPQRWRSSYARTWARKGDEGLAVVYARHCVPRVVMKRLVSQVSHEGIRPISINGQGDTCCLIVTDGYAQLTVIDHPRSRPHPSFGMTREKEREGERQRGREINRKNRSKQETVQGGMDTGSTAETRESAKSIFKKRSKVGWIPGQRPKLESLQSLSSRFTEGSIAVDIEACQPARYSTFVTILATDGPSESPTKGRRRVCTSRGTMRCDATRGEAGRLRRDVKSRGMRTTERIDLSAELRHRTTTQDNLPKRACRCFRRRCRRRAAAAATTVVCAIGIRAASAVVPAGRPVEHESLWRRAPSSVSRYRVEILPPSSFTATPPSSPRLIRIHARHPAQPVRIYSADRRILFPLWPVRKQTFSVGDFSSALAKVASERGRGRGWNFSLHRTIVYFDTFDTVWHGDSRMCARARLTRSASARLRSDKRITSGSAFTPSGQKPFEGSSNARQTHTGCSGGVGGHRGRYPTLNRGITRRTGWPGGRAGGGGPVDIRGRSNYPFRAPLTGPRIIPPSGRPCVGLTRLSSDRVAERRRGGRRERWRRARGYGFGRAASKRKDRGRSQRAGERDVIAPWVQKGGRGRRVPEGVRRTVGGRAKQQQQQQQRRPQRQQEKEGEGESLRGQRESAAPAARSLACSLSHGPLLLLLPPSPRTHACNDTMRRMHARTQTQGPRGVQFRAHARMHAAARCRNRGYSRPRKRASPPNPLLFHRYFFARLVFLLPVRPSASFTFCFFYPSSSRVDRRGKGDKEATDMKSFRDLQSAAPVPSWRAVLSVARIYIRRRE